MQILNFPSRKLNKKKMIIFISICSLLLILLILGIIYAFNYSFREFVDIYIFRKEIKSDSLSTIEISSDEDYYTYAYDKYIAILNKNILYTYNSSGDITKENDVNIVSPIFASNNKFLVIGENGGNSIYLVSGTNVVWQTTVDGNISRLTVNKNGYVSVIVSGTSYKSIVILIDSKGKELFKTYLSSNIAIDTNISNDNKYMAIAEVDYSGSIIKSMVKNISVEKAKNDPTNSVIYNYELPENTLLTDINYQDKNKLICMCNNGIYSFDISDFSNERILEFDDFEFIDINIKNNLIYTTNKTVGFSNTVYANIFNINNSSINTYQFNGSIKSIYTYNEKVAINTGSEVHFIGLNGWLIKKYESYNEINNIVLSDNIAGIIFKDRIEIVEI